VHVGYAIPCFYGLLVRLPVIFYLLAERWLLACGKQQTDIHAILFFVFSKGTGSEDACI
jgi:hypothetical protein